MILHYQRIVHYIYIQTQINLNVLLNKNNNPNSNHLQFRPPYVKFRNEFNLLITNFHPISYNI